MLGCVVEHFHSNVHSSPRLSEKLPRCLSHVLSGTYDHQKCILCCESCTTSDCERGGEIFLLTNHTRLFFFFASLFRSQTLAPGTKTELTRMVPCDIKLSLVTLDEKLVDQGRTSIKIIQNDPEEEESVTFVLANLIPGKVSLLILSDSLTKAKDTLISFVCCSLRSRLKLLTWSSLRMRILSSRSLARSKLYFYDSCCKYSSVSDRGSPFLSTVHISGNYIS